MLFILFFLFIIIGRTMSFNMVIHIFRKQHEHVLVDEDEYSLICLFSDAKILSTSVSLMKSERIFVKVRISWNESEILYLENDIDLLNTFKLFKDRGIGIIHLV